MNVIAEKIDQMINLVDRNLLLISYGQNQEAKLLTFKKSKSLNPAVFGEDKFAFDMVHFLKTHSKHKVSNEELFDIPNLYERDFVKGLEALLIECSTVEDDIERDCFVSRVYRWFTEKLSEFHDLPEIIQRDGRNNATLDDYMRNLKLSDTRFIETTRPNLTKENTALDIPENLNPERNIQSAMKISQRRAKLKSTQNNPDQSTLPNIFRRNTVTAIDSNKDKNYGLLYHQPESETEKDMYELWMARRRQEAFDWKSQKQIDLVMNRLAIHKSRLESNALRRQELNSVMQAAIEERNLASQESESENGENYARFAPAIRISSAGRSRRFINPQAIQARTASKSSENVQKGQNYFTNPWNDRVSEERVTPEEGQCSVFRENSQSSVEPASSVISGGSALAQTTTPSAQADMNTKRSYLKERNLMPMRFGNKLPANFKGSTARTPGTTVSGGSKYEASIADKAFEAEQAEDYMQQSDSDDDDKPEIQTSFRLSTLPAIGKSKGNGPTAVTFKREKPPMRERPESAKIFHTFAIDDAEFKVHYRHTNYRRMPLTSKLEQWLDQREADRAQISKEYTRKLMQEAAAKRGKKKSNGVNNKVQNAQAHSSKQPKGKTSDALVSDKPVKYESAFDFMNKHFPNFDSYDPESDYRDGGQENAGPMRMAQLVECAQIMSAFERMNVPIKEEVVRRALIIPQDRPEALCLESLRDPANTEGLMENPIPREYWRSCRFNLKTAKSKKRRSKKE